MCQSTHITHLILLYAAQQFLQLQFLNAEIGYKSSFVIYYHFQILHARESCVQSVVCCFRQHLEKHDNLCTSVQNVLKIHVFVAKRLYG